MKIMRTGMGDARVVEISQSASAALLERIHRYNDSSDGDGSERVSWPSPGPELARQLNRRNGEPYTTVDGRRLTNSRVTYLAKPLPPRLMLSEVDRGSCWIHLAPPSELSWKQSLVIAGKFTELTAGVTGRPMIDYASVRYAPHRDWENLQPLQAGKVLELYAAYAFSSMPAELQSAIVCGTFEHHQNPCHHGLWAKIDLTRRALGFVARRQLTYVVSRIAELPDRGTLLVGVSLA
jgi:hypothetical protein